jgi:hypothetical protein
MLEEFCFAAFLAVFFARGHALHVLELYFVPVLFSFVIFFTLRMCVKMAMWAETCSERVKTNTVKLHTDGNITCNNH